MAEGSSSSTLPTVEQIFDNYCGRRFGLIRALTADVDKFYEDCKPGEDEVFVCLYGHPDRSWTVGPPAEMVPPEIPEPTHGINHARDGLDRSDWVKMVAIHSDSWLLSVAFFYATCVGLNSAERKRLFTLINTLPNVFEVVSDWRPARNKPRKQKSSEASGSKPAKRSSDGGIKSSSSTMVVEVEESGVASKDEACKGCGGRYIEGADSEFWIACDFCEYWYHGKCVGVTPEMAETLGEYQCMLCAML